MAGAAMQGAAQHIRSSSGLSILPNDTLTCRQGESNQRPSYNKMLALPLSQSHPFFSRDTSHQRTQEIHISQFTFLDSVISVLSFQSDVCCFINCFIILISLALISQWWYKKGVQRCDWQLGGAPSHHHYPVPCRHFCTVGGSGDTLPNFICSQWLTPAML